MKTIALPSTIGLLLCLQTMPAQAIPETWVASNGAGAACTRAAPCATFTAAHTVTDAGGTIKCVDAGNFGQVVITKSITIDCTGTNGGIVNTAGNAIVVNAVDVAVIIRGLSIDGTGTAAVGIGLLDGRSLHVENCAIRRFNGGGAAGIQFNPTGAAELLVTDSTISENGNGVFGGGIGIQPSGSGSALVALNRVTLNRNANGVDASGFNTTGVVVIEVRDSSVARSASTGLFARTDTSRVGIVIDRSTSTLNGAGGISALGPNALVHLGNSTVRGNATGLSVSGGGQILSYQNNQLDGNGVDGAPTGVLTVK
jgi:hypothetical protein